ncbi:MAG: serpin family protein [Planctomycetes bacterium]|nr:serpin family protein [Planctomycetota bacterium]
MRAAIFTLLLLAAWTAVPLAHAQKLDPEIESLVQGNTDFALTLHKRLAADGGNVFFSPYSISNALAMTYAGAKNRTAEEMKTTLRFNLGDDRLHPVFSKLIAQLDGNGKPRPFQLTIANRLWGQKNYGFYPEFLKTGNDRYRAGLEEVDFIRANEVVRGRINSWVEKQTKEKIKDLLKRGAINTDTRLVLTNAIYFKAAWHIPFNAKLTRPEPFFLLDGKKIEPPMMRSRPKLSFADLGDFSILEMPYERHEASMLVILPKKKDGLAEVEKKLAPAALQNWTTALAIHSVDLKLPKFTLTTEFQLNAQLKEMGMRDAFDRVNANFKGMASGKDGNLYISNVVHKAFIGVDEKSTEAAAATAVVVTKFKSRPRQPPPATFHVDHPFLFLIRDQRTGTILFSGRVVNPGS